MEIIPSGHCIGEFHGGANEANHLPAATLQQVKKAGGRRPITGRKLVVCLRPLAPMNFDLQESSKFISRHAGVPAGSR